MERTGKHNWRVIGQRGITIGVATKELAERGIRPKTRAVRVETLGLAVFDLFDAMTSATTPERIDPCRFNTSIGCDGRVVTSLKRTWKL